LDVRASYRPSHWFGAINTPKAATSHQLDCIDSTSIPGATETKLIR